MPSKYYKPHPRASRPAIFPIGPSIAYIQLTRGQYALVDWDDACNLQQWNWHASWNGHTKSYYAVRGTCSGPRTSRIWKSYRMHRELIDGIDEASKGDHANGNTLDNRRINLRAATSTQNACNRVLTAQNKSGHKGVYFHKQSGRWRAIVSYEGVDHYCGSSDTPEGAAKLYAEKVRCIHGEFARLA